MRETYDFMSLPLWVRPNTVLPVSSRNDRPEYDYGDGVLLKVFQLESSKRMRVEIPNLTGNVERHLMCNAKVSSSACSGTGLRSPGRYCW